VTAVQRGAFCDSDRAGREGRQTAADADRTAALADKAATRGDQRAWARDRAAAERDRDRAAALYDRARAADDRVEAAVDRARAADDRARAAVDRSRAARDREQSRLGLQRAYQDELTGVHTRGFGLVRMQEEIERAERSGERFVLAFLDVDGLKEINDRDGHAAGDAVLRAVGAELRSQLRSYDPIVRVGGDEFVCALSDTALQAAAGRMEKIRTAVMESESQASVSVGLAERQPGETLEALTARGDAELYRAKRRG
jgi:diguanylate cyclase (GGDEF)-like protein